MSKKASLKSLLPALDRATTAPPAKIFVVCDHQDNALIRGQTGLPLILEPSIRNSER